MATRVSDLPTIGNVVGNEVIVVLESNNNLATMNTGQIRGAGWFWGVGVGIPDTNFSVSASGWAASYGPYRNGDFYRRETIAGTDVFVLWYWENGAWIEMANTQPQRFWDNNTSASNYDNTVVVTLDAAQFRQGDFYRNLTDNKVYGPSVTGTGINFDPDARLFYYDRGPQAHISTEIEAWNPWDTTVKTDDWYMPRHADTYRQHFADTNHGGYIWSWDDTVFLARIIAGDTVQVARQAAWGNKINARGPQHTSEAVRPAGNSAFDNTRYIAGDTVLARDTLIVWGPYVADQATQVLAWGDSNPLAPSEMIILDDTTGSYLPPANNTLYQTNDILLWNMLRGTTNTPIMYGYDTTRNAGAGGWEFIAYHRAPTILEVFGTDTALVLTPTDARNGPFITAGSPIVGDVVRKIYTNREWAGTVNQNQFTVGERTGRVEDRVIATIDFTSGAITYEGGEAAFTNPHGFRSHLSTTIGSTWQDDETYTEGDLIYSTDGSIFGPYVLGQITPAAAWPIYVTRPDQIFTETSATIDLLPDPDNTVYRSGDYLMYTVTAGVVSLPMMFGPYDETANAGVGSWPLLSVLRSPIDYNLLSVNATFAVHAAITDALYLAEGAPVVGDTVIRIYTDAGGAGPTGKVDERIITAIDFFVGGITYAAPTNPKFGQKWDSGIAGRLPQDDNMFSTGDILTSTTGMIFGPYVEGAIDDETAWPLRASRSPIIFSITEGAVDFLPVVDNTIYIDGDYLIYTMTLGAVDLPIMFGPYDSATGGIWNFNSYLRPPMVINFGAANSVFVEHDSADDTLFTARGMPMVGDSVLQSFSDATTGLVTGKRTIKVITNVDQTTGLITYAAPFNANPTKTWAATGAGRGPFDDNIYTDGDYLQTTSGAIYGPYLEGQITDTLAWPVRTLAPSEQPILITQEGGVGAVFELKIDENNQIFLEEQ